MLLKLSPEKPVLFSVLPNTYPNDWWWSGTTIRIRTISATPTMCHQAENRLSPAVIGTRSMFTSPAPSISTPYATKIQPTVFG
jgi:hypothetical protein